MGSINLAYLVSHPIQYQAPLLRELDNREEINLKVYFCSRHGVNSELGVGFGNEDSWDIPLLEGYDYKFLPNRSPKPSLSPIYGLFNPSILNKLKEKTHDVLWVHDYGSLTNLLAIALAPRLDVPVVLRAEATLPNNLGPKYLFKSSFLRGLDSQVTAYCSIGSVTHDVYSTIGVNEERIFHSPYCVHNQFFQEENKSLPEKARLRDDLNLPSDRPIVLFVGKLIERKQPNLLIDAFIQATEPEEAYLLFVGDGPLKDELEQRVVQQSRGTDIGFAGFVNYSNLPKYYKSSDVFVLPSKEENWGLVVNEAMNFELPIITSTKVGSGKDLVNNQNGRVVSIKNTKPLSHAISELINDEELREMMGRKSLKRIQGWGIEQAANGIVAAAEYAYSS